MSGDGAAVRNGRRRVVLLMLALSVPFVAFGVWMLVIGAYGLAAAWFVLLTVATVVFIWLMLTVLAAKER